MKRLAIVLLISQAWTNHAVQRYQAGEHPSLLRLTARGMSVPCLSLTTESTALLLRENVRRYASIALLAEKRDRWLIPSGVDTSTINFVADTLLCTAAAVAHARAAAAITVAREADRDTLRPRSVNVLRIGTRFIVFNDLASADRVSPTYYYFVFDQAFALLTTIVVPAGLPAYDVAVKQFQGTGLGPGCAPADSTARQFLDYVNDFAMWNTPGAGGLLRDSTLCAKITRALDSGLALPVSATSYIIVRKGPTYVAYSPHPPRATNSQLLGGPYMHVVDTTFVHTRDEAVDVFRLTAHRGIPTPCISGDKSAEDFRESIRALYDVRQPYFLGDSMRVARQDDWSIPRALDTTEIRLVTDTGICTAASTAHAREAGSRATLKYIVPPGDADVARPLPVNVLRVGPTRFIVFNNLRMGKYGRVYFVFDSNFARVKTVIEGRPG